MRGVLGRRGVQFTEKTGPNRILGWHEPPAMSLLLITAGLTFSNKLAGRCPPRLIVRDIRTMIPNGRQPRGSWRSIRKISTRRYQQFNSATRTSAPLPSIGPQASITGAGAATLRFCLWLRNQGCWVVRAGTRHVLAFRRRTGAGATDPRVRAVGDVHEAVQRSASCPPACWYRVFIGGYLVRWNWSTASGANRTVMPAA